MSLFLIDDEQLFLRTLAGDAFRAKNHSVTIELPVNTTEWRNVIVERIKEESGVKRKRKIRAGNKKLINNV